MHLILLCQIEYNLLIYNKLKIDCLWADSARPKGARPVVQTTGFQPPSLPVGGLVRR